MNEHTSVHLSVIHELPYYLQRDIVVCSLQFVLSYALASDYSATAIKCTSSNSEYVLNKHVCLLTKLYGTRRSLFQAIIGN